MPNDPAPAARLHAVSTARLALSGFDAAPPPSSLAGQWLVASLDESDYGMLLLAVDPYERACLCVLHANRAARAELDATHPLVLHGDELHVRSARDAVLLHDAVRSARQRRLRKLLALGSGDRTVGVTVKPLPGTTADGLGAVLLMLGRQQVCETLTMQSYAANRGLTPAESRVLAALSRGQRPEEIAAGLGVQISTVRTQIGSIRLKTGVASIGELVRRVSVLPPLMGVLHSMAAEPQAA